MARTKTALQLQLCVECVAAVQAMVCCCCCVRSALSGTVSEAVTSHKWTRSSFPSADNAAIVPGLIFSTDSVSMDCVMAIWSWSHLLPVSLRPRLESNTHGLTKREHYIRRFGSTYIQRGVGGGKHCLFLSLLLSQMFLIMDVWFHKWHQNKCAYEQWNVWLTVILDWVATIFSCRFCRWPCDTQSDVWF